MRNLCSFRVIFLRDPQRTEFGSRVRTFCIFLLLVVLGRVMILDRFFYPMFDTLEICILFCSDTRQLAIAFCQTWAIFTVYICAHFSAIC